jgi:hypothetical protein
MKRSRLVIVFGVLLGGVIIISLMAIFAPNVFRLRTPNGGGSTVAQPANGANTAAQPAGGTSEKFFLARMMEESATDGSGAAFISTVEIIQRLLLAVVLSGILAFRPRKNVPLFKRSLFVSQTQILLAVVAAALMLIVGDNTARAFAIFAAVSLVRFRTNIRDPKEITVLLISLSLGLAAGVGRWDLGISLCLFALCLLWLLEFKEPEQVFRSMELSVRSRDPERTQDILKKIFDRMKIDAEVREITPPDGKKDFGTIVFYLNMRLKLTTDKLSDRILAADEKNIEGISWSKTKNAGDLYQ